MIKIYKKHSKKHSRKRQDSKKSIAQNEKNINQSDDSYDLDTSYTHTPGFDQYDNTATILDFDTVNDIIKCELDDINDISIDDFQNF